MASASKPDPMVEVRRRVDNLHSKLTDIQQKALLASVRDEAEDVETRANKVADLARSARERGYAWEKDLEPLCLDFRKRWAELKPGVTQAIVRETAALRTRVSQAEANVAQAAARATNPAFANSLLTPIENELQTLEGAADAAEKAVRGMFDNLSSEISKLETHLNRVIWMLDQGAESKATWLSMETLVKAVKAKWDQDGKEDPKGVLFLTDQRLVFERKEEVATKKVLFVTTEKEKVQEVLLEILLSEMTEVTASKKGMLGHEDHLDFEFQPGAKIRKAHFHIDGQDCNEWQATIGRVRSGEIEKNRATPISEEEKQRIQNAPTKCVSCGGILNAPILRGQTVIHCPYCAAVTRF